MKKVVSLVVLTIAFNVFAFSYSFLDIPTSAVISDGTFQMVSVNGFGISSNSIMIGLLDFYQMGIKNSGFLTQFQIFKTPMELSVGTVISEQNSFFLTIGKNFNHMKISAGISYYPEISEVSTRSHLSIYTSILIPIQIGNIRFEYKKNTYNTNSFALGIAKKFTANDSLKWLFNSITIAGGLGWNFVNNSFNIFPNETYFVAEYSKALK